MKRKLLLAALCVVSAIGGGNSLMAQTDVTSTYITNPSFESDGSKAWAPSNNNTVNITGWTVNLGNPGGSYENTGIYDASNDSPSGFGKKVTPADGTYYFFNRRGWATVTNTLSTTSKAEMPVGVYIFSAKYKIAYSDNTGDSQKPTVTLKARQNGSDLTTATSVGGPKGPGDSYFNTSDWQEIAIPFTVSTAGNVDFVIEAYLDGGHGRGDILLDDIRLYNVLAATESDPANCSGFIKNSNLGNNNTEGWTATSTYTNWNANGFSNGNKQQWNGNFTFYQTISNIPNGKYKISVQGFYRPGDNGAESQAQNALLYAGTEYTQPLELVQSEAKTDADATNGFTTAYGTVGYVPNSQADAAKAFNSGAYNNELTFKVINHSIEVGTKKETLIGNDWTVFDNFKLQLIEPSIADYAETYSTEVSVVAGKWYVYDVAATGEYKFVSNTNNTITYTQAGSDVASDVTLSANLTADTEELVNLTIGKLYFMVTADATLTVAPNTYSYSVGTATPSVTDGAYVQSNTLTITFDASTNDPDGALSIWDDTKIKVNDEAATASLAGNVLTITLASTLATSTNYAVSIEAGAVGYNAENTNAAFSLTLHTPAVFDGTFFIATTDGEQFISRGGDSNTEAVLDKFGIAVNVTTDASNVTNFVFVDNDKNLFGGSSSIYTDKNATDLGDNAPRKNWTVAAVDGGYTFYSIVWDKYIKAGTGTESGANAATYSDEAYKWVLEAPDTHQAKMAAYKDANAAAVATAADLNVTTVEELKTALTDNFTSDENITLSNAYSNVSEKYQPNGYGETIISEQTLTNLKNGIYKVSLSAFHRIRDNATTYNLHSNYADNPTSYLYANDQIMQLPSSMSEYSQDPYGEGWPNFSPVDGENYPNNTGAAGTAFSNGLYKVEVFAVVKDGTLKIGLKDPGKYSNANWICFCDLKVTAYTYDGDYEALGEAITSAENNIGFEADEYAPYNNVESMEKLAAAKALYASQDAINQDAIDEVKAALTSATWTANTKEVNAIYDGDFNAAKDNVASNTLPTGWHGSDSHYSEGYWVRYVYGTSSSNAGLMHFENGSGMMSKSTPRYGLDEGYTMPLKADTYYKLTFDYAGWNSQLVTTVRIYDGNGDEISVTPSATEESANAGQTNVGDWKSYTGIFKTEDAGDYVLKFDKKEHDGNGGQVAYGAIELKKAPVVEANMKITAAKYATFIAPFDVEIPDGVTAMTVAETTALSTTLELTSLTDIIPANTPVVLYGEVEKDEDFSGQNTATQATYTVGALTGVYANTSAPVGSYVLQNHQDGGIGFYQVAEGKQPTVGANRAYLTDNSDQANVRAFFFDSEDLTGIDAIGTLTSGQYDAIYTGNGVKVKSLQKGMNIVVKGSKSYKIFVK